MPQKEDYVGRKKRHQDKEEEIIYQFSSLVQICNIHPTQISRSSQLSRYLYFNLGTENYVRLYNLNNVRICLKLISESVFTKNFSLEKSKSWLMDQVSEWNPKMLQFIWQLISEMGSTLQLVGDSNLVTFNFNRFPRATKSSPPPVCVAICIIEKFSFLARKKREREREREERAVGKPGLGELGLSASKVGKHK